MSNELGENYGAALVTIEKVKHALDTLWFESNDGDVIHVDHIYDALGIDSPADVARPELRADPWAAAPATNDETILEGERAA